MIFKTFKQICRKCCIGKCAF